MKSVKTYASIPTCDDGVLTLAIDRICRPN